MHAHVAQSQKTHISAGIVEVGMYEAGRRIGGVEDGPGGWGWGVVVGCGGCISLVSCLFGDKTDNPLKQQQKHNSFSSSVSALNSFLLQSLPHLHLPQYLLYIIASLLPATQIPYLSCVSESLSLSKKTKKTSMGVNLSRCVGDKAIQAIYKN